MDIRKNRTQSELWNLIVLTHLDKTNVDAIDRIITAILDFFT